MEPSKIRQQDGNISLHFRSLRHFRFAIGTAGKKCPVSRHKIFADFAVWVRFKLEQDMEPMPRTSLEQMLANIPEQNQQMLDGRVSDIHLEEIARSLVDWKSVCTTLGIVEAEEAAIEEENRTVDLRRFVINFYNFCHSFVQQLSVPTIVLHIRNTYW